MSEAWAVLERHFDGLTADEVDAELAQVPAQGATPASAAAADYLAEHGGPDLDGDDAVGDVHRRRAMVAARTLSETLRSAVTIDEAAKLLGVSRSRVSHRLADQTLWAFAVQGRRYVPRWQLSESRSLPGLELLVPAIPDTLHPLAVDAFMATPRADFDDRSPVEWLASGGDPTVIAEWLVGMAHG